MLGQYLLCLVLPVRDSMERALPDAAIALNKRSVGGAVYVQAKEFISAEKRWVGRERLPG